MVDYYHITSHRIHYHPSLLPLPTPTNRPPLLKILVKLQTLPVRLLYSSSSYPLTQHRGRVLDTPPPPLCVLYTIQYWQWQSRVKAKSSCPLTQHRGRVL